MQIVALGKVTSPALVTSQVRTNDTLLPSMHQTRRHTPEVRNPWRRCIISFININRTFTWLHFGSTENSDLTLEHLCLEFADVLLQAAMQTHPTIQWCVLIAISTLNTRRFPPPTDWCHVRLICLKLPRHQPPTSPSCTDYQFPARLFAAPFLYARKASCFQLLINCAS